MGDRQEVDRRGQVCGQEQEEWMYGERGGEGREKEKEKEISMSPVCWSF